MASSTIAKDRRRLSVGQCDPVASPSQALAKGTQNTDYLKNLKEAHPGKTIVSLNSTTDKDMKRRRSFAEKDQKTDAASTLTDQLKQLKNRGIGLACKKGMKPEAPNQDSFSLLIVEGVFALYGVFDGHGPSGHDVSDKARDILTFHFLSHEESATNTRKAFEESFVQTQVDIVKYLDVSRTSMSGSTCTMAYHDIVKGTVTIAHVGDSRAVLGLMKKAGTYDGAEAMTVDHKPENPGERARIEKMGGRVEFDGYYNYRVFAAAGMYPGLNMSRALGDCVAHAEAGLTAMPEVREIKLSDYAATNEVVTLFLCSDGVWEFIESEQVINVVGKLPTQQAAEALAAESYKRWMDDSAQEVADDITVLMINFELKPAGA